ncbi:MAG: hypothetical protein ACQEW8_07235 [Actinomycetota bacterium]
MRVVRGDLEVVPILNAADPALVRGRSQALEGTLVVTAASVASVLQRLDERNVEPGTVQAWASLVRWGLLAGSSDHPAAPIDFEYEGRFEDEIVEVLGRLDELGDVIDGVVSAAEIRRLLDLLEE